MKTTQTGGCNDSAIVNDISMSLIVNKPASSPANTAPCAATATAAETQPCASPCVKATCVAVEDMGVMTTKFGRKPMVKFTFETDEVNEFGYKRRLTRLFHKHFHPMSALSTTAKRWCNRDLAAEQENIGEVDLQSFVDSAAQVRLEPGIVKDGKCFERIAAILPPDHEEVQEARELEDNE
jgi:hypothetical protein